MPAYYELGAKVYSDQIPRRVHVLHCACDEDNFSIYQEDGTDHFHFQCVGCDQPYCPSGCLLPAVVEEPDEETSYP